MGRILEKKKEGKKERKKEKKKDGLSGRERREY